jgi:CMP-N-acetylneuraminic acid synthetase
MKLPTIALLLVILLLGACSSLLQTASISEAYKHYDRQQYNRTLALISQAENAEVISAETRAELTYLKAMTYEEMNEIETANTLYQFLAQEHSHSQYGYMAAKKLNAN